ncbi:hypothetical protein D3C81_1234640 [compost metagenome]
MPIAVADRRGDAADRLPPFAPVDRIAEPAHLVQLLQEALRLDDAVRRGGGERPSHPLQRDVGLERQHGFPRRHAVCQRPPPDLRIGPHRVGAVDLVHVHDFAPIQHGQVHALIRGLHQLLHPGFGVAAQVQPGQHRRTELPELDRGAIPHAAFIADHEMQIDQRLQQAMHIALGHPEMPGDLGKAERAVAMGKELDDMQSLDQRVVHARSFPG